jgi:hypothetical protein
MAECGYGRGQGVACPGCCVLLAAFAPACAGAGGGGFGAGYGDWSEEEISAWNVWCADNNIFPQHCDGGRRVWGGLVGLSPSGARFWVLRPPCPNSPSYEGEDLESDTLEACGG